jgi:hypothetical protein
MIAIGYGGDSDNRFGAVEWCCVFQNGRDRVALKDDEAGQSYEQEQRTDVSPDARAADPIRHRVVVQRVAYR